ncbi:hypothetical protein N0V93_003033 [Gnomoniopsis smithogilvyi]|uniref:Uncharacterized protein n=1 Tax=Gnomoniopsis smithogilvyi TaxID=1191159 RepID=A0A9W8YXT5_9PEZI|nr:hypothetical protein N0V93_003033 [Gnomoniopsis smithogilvyi]
MEALAAFLEYAINAARLAFQITGNARPEQKSDLERTIQHVRDSLRILEKTKDNKTKLIGDKSLQSLVTACLGVASDMRTVDDNLEDQGKGTWKLVEGLQKTGYLIYKGKDLQRL